MVDFLFIIFFILFWAIFFPCSDDGIASKKFKKKIEKNIDIRYWLIVDDEIFFFISTTTTTSTSSYQITIIFFWLSDYNRITTTTTTNFSITKLTHTHLYDISYINNRFSIHDSFTYYQYFFLVMILFDDSLIRFLFSFIHI